MNWPSMRGKRSLVAGHSLPESESDIMTLVLKPQRNLQERLLVPYLGEVALLYVMLL